MLRNNTLGVAHLTALELEPVELVREASRVGFNAVGLRLHPATPGGLAYPLLPGSQLLREVKTALQTEAVTVNEIEFIELTPDVDIDSFARLLEAGAELGARCLTVSGDDPDQARLEDNLARLCVLAGQYRMRVDIEFMRWRQIATLQQAVALVTAAGQGNAAVLIDALHLFRSGGDAEMIRALPARWFRALQLSDAPRAAPPQALIITEAREGRLLPGQGELALQGLLSALADDIYISVEIPDARLDPTERLARAFSVTQAWLTRARCSERVG